MSAPSGPLALRWGDATLRELRAAIKRAETIKLELPLGTHHALFCRLNPGAEPGASEICSVESDASLLARIATVAGLEELSALEHATRAARYRVHLSTPDPVLTFLPPGAS